MSWKNKSCGSCDFRVGHECKHSPPDARKNGSAAIYPVVVNGYKIHHSDDEPVPGRIAGMPYDLYIDACVQYKDAP